MFRKVFFSLLLLLCSTTLMAQGVTSSDLQLADRLFGFLFSNQADSLYAYMNADMKAALPKEQLKDVMPQMESMMGAYVNHDPWRKDTLGGMEVCVADVNFENGQLSALFTFDADGLVSGMRLMPKQLLPSASDSTAPPLPSDAIELDATVHTNDSTDLPATITLSGRSASPPMVVMVHGSGSLDRDETVMANKTFLDLARQLASQGISTLRYDKRTFVYPQRTVNTMDEETTLDAMAAIAFARTYSNNVFVLGHSLGAMLAPIIATQAGNQIDGIIMMAGNARNLTDVLAEQLDYLLPPGTNEAEKEQSIEQIRRQAPHYLQPQGQVEAARQLQLPMLIMQGGRDYQVTMTDFALWQQALDGKPNVVFHSYPSLNHLFLEGEGKSKPQEYMVNGSIPQQVIADIAAFIFSVNHSN